MATLPTSPDVESAPPKSLGLWGDGDEIDAIQDVERAFGVKLDYADAPNWLTAGDVYRALLMTLPGGADADPQTWTRFACAITDANGADPSRITRESTLIEQTNVFAQLRDLLRGWLK